jgi:hypothetical protein
MKEENTLVNLFRLIDSVVEENLSNSLKDTQIDTINSDWRSILIFHYEYLIR